LSEALDKIMSDLVKSAHIAGLKPQISLSWYTNSTGIEGKD